MQGKIELLILAIVAVISFGCSSDDIPRNSTVPEPIVYFIDSVYPADSATQVPTNTNIRATFLRPMDTALLTGEEFYISGGAGYQYSSNHHQITIWPTSGLQENTEYELAIKSGIADTVGNIMAYDYTWSFTTGMDNLFIDSTYPRNGATGVPFDASIKAYFSRDIDSTTINNTTFYLSDGVSGTVTYNNRIAEFIPSDSLTDNHIYSVALRGEIKDINGTPLNQMFSWSFTTAEIIWPDTTPPFVTGVSPADNEVAVWVDDNIYIVFSEKIDATSITLEDITISDGITGSIDVLNNNIVFDPIQNLEYDSLYTVIFDGVVSDTIGNEVQVFHSWSFRTEVADTVLPSIVSLLPEPGSPAVPIESNVSIIFNKAIDSTSVMDGYFSIDQNTGFKSGDISVSNNIITFDPHELLSRDRSTTAEFHGEIKDLRGNTVMIDTAWSFITRDYLSVISTFPKSNGYLHDSLGTIQIEFSYEVDETTVSWVGINIEDELGNNIYGDFNVSGSSVYFTPYDPWDNSTTYIVKVIGVRNIFGDPLKNYYGFEFKTLFGDLMPLAVGNWWEYKVIKCDSAYGPCYNYREYYDTITIVDDTLITSELWYIDNDGEILTNRSNGLWKILNGQPQLWIEFPVDASNPTQPKIKEISVPAGIFMCYEFSYGGTRYFSPNTGLVKHVYPTDYYYPFSRKWKELVSYHIEQ